jgi:hypothetical protein
VFDTDTVLDKYDGRSIFEIDRLVEVRLEERSEDGSGRK